jgi:hypothetical protein
MSFSSWRLSFVQPCIAASSNAAIASERAQPRRNFRSNAQPLPRNKILNACKMMGMLILQIKGLINWLAIACRGQRIQLQRRQWRHPSRPPTPFAFGKF